MAKAKPQKLPERTSEIITFRDPRGYGLDNLAKNEPFCWNGVVGVRRFRVSVEIVEEPNEVIIERIKKLWSECDNHHHWQPLQNAAAEFGLELNMDDCGKTRKK